MGQINSKIKVLKFLVKTTHLQLPPRSADVFFKISFSEESLPHSLFDSTKELPLFAQSSIIRWGPREDRTRLMRRSFIIIATACCWPQIICKRATSTSLRSDNKDQVINIDSHFSLNFIHLFTRFHPRKSRGSSYHARAAWSRSSPCSCLPTRYPIPQWRLRTPYGPSGKPPRGG